MRSQSPALTIGRTVLKESDDLVKFSVTFSASSLGFQSSFSTAWYLEEAWQVFHDRLLLWGCYLGFILLVLEYCSAVWCSAADAHLKLLDRVISGYSFLTAGDVFECDLAHRRFVAVLCMLYKIRCNLMHPFNAALPVPYVPVRLWASSLQNLAVLQDFYSPVSISVERS